MLNDLKVTYFLPVEPGVRKTDNGYSFVFDAGTVKPCDCGIILYDQKGEKTKIPFSGKDRCGTLYGMHIEGLPSGRITYQYYRDKKLLTDPYARALTGFKGFGKMVPKDSVLSVFSDSGFDWEDDRMLRIPYEDSILYGLNVRSFTMHRSSKVKNKGTFEGIVEKIPYLTDLGITGVVLMPAYEFDECAAMREKDKPADQEEARARSFEKASSGRVNCWGFLKGAYFAPKASFSASEDPEKSFKEMVKALHKAGIEVLMHFYFPEETSQLIMMEALKFWVKEYHVDGFRLSGFHLPYRMLLTEPGLRDTKLWFSHIPYEELSAVPDVPDFRNLSSDNGNFRHDIRRFLKGDEGMLNPFIGYQKNNPAKNAVINYICDYDGFTLLDLYSYERKHNEENGEENRDGTDINYSWNCGSEGPTRKKAINLLRMKEIKNALSLVFLSAGTPYLYAGDEFLNSRSGNNNAYCQDNDTGYVEWKDTVMSREILSFTKQLIALRKENRILHMPSELTLVDQKGEGYPDLSYHGFEAWRPDLTFISRMIGLFLYGPYSGNKKAPSFYIGINMHWENHRLAVPKLKNGQVYEKILDTSERSGTSRDNEIPVGERSVAVYKAVAGSPKK